MSNLHEGLTLTGVMPHTGTEHKDFFDIENSKFLYARGFVMCKSLDLHINQHFARIDIGAGYYLYHHFLLQPVISLSDDRERTVILLGTAYFTDPAYIADGKNESDVLLEKLSISEECFFKALDYLAGRYAVICIDKGKVFVVNDPCGLRTVFYNKDADCIGSHLELVNSVAKRGWSDIAQDILKNKYGFMYAYPGNYTKYDNIFMLVPNFVLYLTSFTTKRFFPHEKLEKTTDVYEVKNRYYDKMQFSMEQLIKKGKKFCFSLTGGMDSRVSFYSTQKYKDDIVYFTESRDNDLELSKRLASDNGLNWIGTDRSDIKLDDNIYAKKYREILERNIFPRSSMSPLQNMFWNLNIFGTADEYIHIHSNCAEAGRGRPADVEMPFSSSDFNFDLFLDAYFKSTYIYTSPKYAAQQRHKMENDDLLISKIKDYYDELNVEACVSLGYNPWDLLYIEQRIAFFLAQQHMLNDALFDSISLTNSREILNLMWSLPEKYIGRSCVLYHCILNEEDAGDRELNMGRNFVPSASQEETDNYGSIYAGYILAYDMCSDEKIKLAEKVIKINKTVKWAYKMLIQECVNSGKWQKAADIYIYIYMTKSLREIS